MHSTSYLSNDTLKLMTHFLLKVDMSFTDPNQAAYPVQYPGLPAKYAHNIPTGIPLRKLLLAERHLTSLWRVLRGWTWDPTQPRIPLTKLETLRLWVRHKYHLPEDTPEDVKRLPIMGMPWWEIGTAGYERTGIAFFSLDGGTTKTPVAHPAIMSPALSRTHLGNQLLYPHARVIHLPNVLEKSREQLLGPDALLLKACVKREMSIHKEWAHMMLWGFCDELGFNWPAFSEGEYGRLERRECNVEDLIEERKEARREKRKREEKRRMALEEEKLREEQTANEQQPEE